MPKGSRYFRKFLTYVLVLSGLGFMSFYILRHGDDVRRLLATVDSGMVAYGISALFLSNIGAAIIFTCLVRAEVGRRAIGPMRGVRTFLLSQVAKYVPGRVWGAVLQGSSIGPELPIQALLRINLDLAIMAAMTTCGVAFVFLAWAKWGGISGALGMASLVLANWYGLRFRPSSSLNGALAKFINKLPSPEPGSGEVCVGRTQLFLGVTIFTVGYALGWFLFICGITAVSSQVGLKLTSILSLSYLVGLLSLLPAGLGAREAFLVASSGWSGQQVALLAWIALASRLAMVLVDALLLVAAGVLSIFHAKD